MTHWHTIKQFFGGTHAPLALDRGFRHEKRVAVRKPQRLVQGYIYTSRIAPRACAVVDLSSVGAGIRLWHDDIKSHKLPDTITLCLPADNKEIDCLIIWQSGSRLGVKFCGRFRAPTRRHGPHH